MTKTDVFIRFRRSSLDGGKRCENANVDVNTFMRFQETENGGFRKRISVDGASGFIKLLTQLSKTTFQHNQYQIKWL